MFKIHRPLALLVASLLTACASIPSGTSVMALPGSGKNFDQFRHDDYQCRQFAHEQVGGVTPNQASLTSGATSAAIGAGLGAAAGALIGAGSGHAGSGAAIGAGSGLIAGGLIGTGNARVSGRIAQRRYDNNYVQCMYAQGHRVPVHGQILENPVRSGNSYQNINNIPPPPPGNPPPPPN
ncbi:MAG: hypothetical protein IH810_04955 [Proteobacteria bacterium]|nr:hypothetical protein [Pseudomonadota bacterium]